MKILILNIALLFSLAFPANFSYAQCSGCPAEEKCTPETAKQKHANTSSEDEFTDFDESEEFSDFNENDEFSDYKEGQDTTSADEFRDFRGTMADDESVAAFGLKDKALSNFQWVMGILLLTIIAGFLVRHKSTRQVKTVILLGTVVILGFYRGGCPCMISSFQDLVLAGFGQEVHPVNLIWFLALIPVTYIFGQVWCGWVCHLGAFQEFLYRKNRLTFLQGQKAQQVMKIMRIVLLVALIVQLALTQSNLFIKIDPFKVAFNLTSFYTTGWILLGLLLISSLFINRPFCRAACPVGLVLGLVSKIPGAAILAVKKDECSGCKLCSEACETGAIQRVGKISVLKNTDCILCGECMDDCKKSGLTVQRKNKENGETVILERCEKKEPISIKTLTSDLEKVKN